MAFEVASIRLSKQDVSTPANISMEIDDYYPNKGGFLVADRTLATFSQFIAVQMALKPEADQMLLWSARDISMERLAAWLPVVPPRELGRVVVDQTGLGGTFDFTVEWEYSPEAANSASADWHGPSLEEAVVKQLGLKLKPIRASVPVMVVDHIEGPSEN